MAYGPKAAIDDYFEYTRIVGDDDGGKLFTPQEYEKYKKRVLPIRAKNRLYVSWTSPTGIDCKLIGPETPCFCTHRYKQHKTDFEVIPSERPIAMPCRAKGCLCKSYHYIPAMGSQHIKCSACKHPSNEHSPKSPYKCARSNCGSKQCQGFKTSYTCLCGELANKHQTIIETKEERENRGHPVSKDDVPYIAMGGLTGFSSLAEGYIRCDPSGAGQISKEQLNQPITSSDHPFLRTYGIPPMNKIKAKSGKSSTCKLVKKQ
ncbi:Protein FAM221A [Trichoplax sp. H2]|uniref:Protein FAM221A n=1 Tax=Trichoplax adhaerens TaxID=10228 RepID=B3RQQ5_TRIAD|nr:hypothetical protein TRIADDRAFT_55076 [Trichoplax adhaerens]EDV26740.1 hypothetical protein TRIADDRAFT_55076 [Trichoplax adhaerens]RDD38629.1 Protein FAM221A [Trichoplax sp. H2]|eukprot:XP_002110736.1 hypothetical protein TRIADDRAFT_55076 [Trichoplax adhaerens]